MRLKLTDIHVEKCLGNNDREVKNSVEEIRKCVQEKKGGGGEGIWKAGTKGTEEERKGKGREERKETRKGRRKEARQRGRDRHPVECDGKGKQV